MGSIGMGSFGDVLKAEDRHTNRAVAMKAMPAFPDTKGLKLMLTEVNTLKACGKHPNIVHFYGLYMEEDTLYLAMEYINGMDAFKLTMEAEILPPHIAYITKAVVGALAFIHGELNIIHCDIKPDNILISQTGEVKVADFGLSSANSDKEKGKRKGSLHYMSPEVMNSDQYSYEVDVWSVGVSVFVLAEGVFPYDRITRESSEVCRIISNALHKPKLPKSYPQKMRSFVQCCLRHKSSRPEAKQLLTHPWLLNACSQENMAHLMKLICR